MWSSYHYVKVCISINGGVKIYRIVGHYSNPQAALTEYMIVLLEYLQYIDIVLVLPIVGRAPKRKLV